MIQGILAIIKIFSFFLNLWKENDTRRSEEKAAVAKEVVDAFKEVDPKLRASRLNAAIGNINRLRS